MDMDKVRRSANNPIWHDGERSRREFRYPLPATPWQAGRWTLRGDGSPSPNGMS